MKRDIDTKNVVDIYNMLKVNQKQNSHVMSMPTILTRDWVT